MENNSQDPKPKFQLTVPKSKSSIDSEITLEDIKQFRKEGSVKKKSQKVSTQEPANGSKTSGTQSSTSQPEIDAAEQQNSDPFNLGPIKLGNGSKSDIGYREGGIGGSFKDNINGNYASPLEKAQSEKLKEMKAAFGDQNELAKVTEVPYNPGEINQGFGDGNKLETSYKNIFGQIAGEASKTVLGDAANASEMLAKSIENNNTDLSQLSSIEYIIKIATESNPFISLGNLYSATKSSFTKGDSEIESLPQEFFSRIMGVVSGINNSGPIGTASKSFDNVIAGMSPEQRQKSIEDIYNAKIYLDSKTKSINDWQSENPVERNIFTSTLKGIGGFLPDLALAALTRGGSGEVTAAKYASMFAEKNMPKVIANYAPKAAAFLEEATKSSLTKVFAAKGALKGGAESNGSVSDGMLKGGAEGYATGVYMHGLGVIAGKVSPLISKGVSKTGLTSEYASLIAHPLANASVFAGAKAVSTPILEGRLATKDELYHEIGMGIGMSALSMKSIFNSHSKANKSASELLKTDPIVGLKDVLRSKKEDLLSDFDPFIDIANLQKARDEIKLSILKEPDLKVKQELIDKGLELQKKIDVRIALNEILTNKSELIETFENTKNLTPEQKTIVVDRINEIHKEFIEAETNAKKAELSNKVTEAKDNTEVLADRLANATTPEEIAAIQNEAEATIEQGINATNELSNQVKNKPVSDVLTPEPQAVIQSTYDVGDMLPSTTEDTQTFVKELLPDNKAVVGIVESGIYREETIDLPNTAENAQPNQETQSNTEPAPIVGTESVNVPEAKIKSAASEEVVQPEIADSGVPSGDLKEENVINLDAQKPKPKKYNKNSRTAKQIDREPNSFNDAVNQFFIGGGKLSTEDFITHTGFGFYKESNGKKTKLNPSETDEYLNKGKLTTGEKITASKELRQAKFSRKVADRKDGGIDADMILQSYIPEAFSGDQDMSGVTDIVNAAANKTRGGMLKELEASDAKTQENGNEDNFGYSAEEIAEMEALDNAIIENEYAFSDEDIEALIENESSGVLEIIYEEISNEVVLENDIKNLSDLVDKYTNEQGIIDWVALENDYYSTMYSNSGIKFDILANEPILKKIFENGNAKIKKQVERSKQGKNGSVNSSSKSYSEDVSRGSKGTRNGTNSQENGGSTSNGGSIGEQVTPKIEGKPLPELKPNPVEITPDKYQYDGQMRKLGYTETDIDNLTLEQKRDIVSKKQEKAVVENSAIVNATDAPKKKTAATETNTRVVDKEILENESKEEINEIAPKTDTQANGEVQSATEQSSKQGEGNNVQSSADTRASESKAKIDKAKKIVNENQSNVDKLQNEVNKLSEKLAKNLKENQANMFGDNKTQSLFDDKADQQKIFNDKLTELREAQESLVKAKQELANLKETEGQVELTMPESKVEIDGEVVDLSETTPKQDADIIVKSTLNPFKLISFIQKGVDKLENNTTSALIPKITDMLAETLQAWRTSKNTIKNVASSVASSIFGGIARTDKDVSIKLGLIGGKNMAVYNMGKLMKSLYGIIDNNTGSLERIHVVMDPDFYQKGLGGQSNALNQNVPPNLTYNDLTAEEKMLHDEIRKNLDEIHFKNYALGFIDVDTFNKHKGTYVPRMYETNELPAETQEILDAYNKQVGTKLNLNPFKKRKDLDQLSEDSKNAILKDPVYLMAKRMMELDTNSAIQNYINHVNRNNKNLVYEGPDADAPFQFVKLEGKAYGALNGKYVAGFIAEDLKGYFFVNKGLNLMYDGFKMYDRTGARQFVKKGLTVFNPFVQLGNFTSNVVFAQLGGVDFVRWFGNSPSAIKELINKGADYETLLAAGLIGTDVVTNDFAPNTTRSNSLLQQKKDKEKGGLLKKLQSPFTKASDKATQLYSGNDDYAKINAYQIYIEQGYSKDEALKKVYDAFQNYATVGKFWDVAAKIPVFGPVFVKFAADLMRITGNAVAKKPLSSALYLAGLMLIPQILKSIGASEEEDELKKELRTNRPFIPKMELGFVNIPLVYKTKIGEINLARYITPYYFFDSGDDGEDKILPGMLNRFNPYKEVKSQGYGKGNESEIAFGQDPVLGTLYNIMLDTDFRGKSIQDPQATRFRASGVTNNEKWLNRGTHALRTWIPNGALMHDTYLNAKYGADSYGRTRTMAQTLINFAIKIQDFKESDYKKTAEKQVFSITNDLRSQVETIKNTYVTDSRERQGKQKSLLDGSLSKEDYQRSIERLDDRLKTRIEKAYEKKAEIDKKLTDFRTKYKRILDE